MKTYQDLLKVGENEKDRKDFVKALINEHKSSHDYKIAKEAYEYFCHRNVTINEYRKLLYDMTGKAIPDNYSANFKMASRHFYRFIVQEVQYLLGNGVTWGEESTEEKLGTKNKSFDSQLKKAAKAALWGRASYGFYDKDHVEVFDYLEFVPLFDEMDGSMKAGVRFWQIDSGKPMKATLYEIDGFTKYVYDPKSETTEYDEQKRGYIQNLVMTEADGAEIYDEQNYPTFPIVPLWANDEHQSEIVGLREQIDCFDLIKSGFANDVDDASVIYWTIQNAGGMTDIDLAKFVKRMKTIKAAVVQDDGAKAESHTQEVPYASREALLDRLENDLYKDAMALDVDRISDGAVTATQIKAAYEDLNIKCDDFEYQVLEFIQGILAIAGVEDEASFTRSQLVNQTELVTAILQSGSYLSQEYVTRKILDVLGDGDQAEDVLSEMYEADYNRMMANEPDEDENGKDGEAKNKSERQENVEVIE